WNSVCSGSPIGKSFLAVLVDHPSNRRFLPEDAPAVLVTDPILVRQIWQQRFKLRVEFLHLRIFPSELIEPVLNGLAVTAVRAARIHCVERDAVNSHAHK